MPRWLWILGAVALIALIAGFVTFGGAEYGTLGDGPSGRRRERRAVVCARSGRLMPYLWPKGRPDLRMRVVVSHRLPDAGHPGAPAFPAADGWAGHRPAGGQARANIAIGTTLALIGGLCGRRAS